MSRERSLFDASPARDRGEPMTEADNVRILTRFIEEVWNGQQLPVLDEIMNDDYLVHFQDVDPGIEGYRRIWRSTTATMPGLHFTMKHVIAKDDKVTLLYLVDRPGAKQVGTAIYRFANGKMAECWAPPSQPYSVEREASLEGLAVAPAPQGSSTEEANVALLRRFIGEVWNGHQVAVLDQVMHDRYVVHFVVVEPGLAGYKAIWHRATGARPEMRFITNDVLAKDDKVVLRYNVIGIPNPYDGVAIYRFAEGKMVECWAVEPGAG